MVEVLGGWVRHTPEKLGLRVWGRVRVGVRVSMRIRARVNIRVQGYC